VYRLIFSLFSKAFSKAEHDIDISSYGKKLLGFCKGNNLFIVNGRIGDDRNNGKLT
jgi:hypothetical protein